MTPDMSIIICAYTEERWDDLIASIESVKRQSVPAKEIVVVIDHNPRLLQRVSSEVSGIVAAENRLQRGLSGARNTGVEMAKGDIIGFLDDDAVAAPDWLARLSAGYADGSVLGVGGAIDPVWRDSRPGWFPEEFDWVVGCTYRGMPSAAGEVRNLIGCNMSFRREVFEAIGGFRDGIGRVGVNPVGCEETELCIRIRQRWPDHRLLYEPQAKVFHKAPSERAGWKYFRSRCYSEGRSKALVSRYVGGRDGLASERSYTFRVLPQSVLRGFADVMWRRDPSGPARSGAIIAGFSLTAFGFLVGAASDRLRRQWRAEAELA